MITTDTQPEDLRNNLIDHIREAGHLHSNHIERALRTVPRHLFVPDATLAGRLRQQVPHHQARP